MTEIKREGDSYIEEAGGASKNPPQVNWRSVTGEEARQYFKARPEFEAVEEIIAQSGAIKEVTGSREDVDGLLKELEEKGEGVRISRLKQS